MTEGIKKTNPPSSRDNEVASGGNSKKRIKGERFPTKVVVRKLPPSMNLESFLDNVSPLPDNDYVNFVPADNSLLPHNYSRAYINFTNQEDLLIFTQKFDNYVFVDSKGHEYPALVEFAPFQRIPKMKNNKKKDSKCSTIEDDPHFTKFKERLQAEEEESESGKQNVFETTLPDDIPEKVTSTPLLEYLRKRREEKKRIREEKKEERKKRELERRKVKDEQRRAKKVVSTTPSAMVPASAPSEATEPAETSAMNSAGAVSKEKERAKDKDPQGRRGAKDLLKAIKVKEKLTSVSKDKEKAGKSYREERLRRIEQREELRRKNTKTSDACENLIPEAGNKDKKVESTFSQVHSDEKDDKYKKQKPKTDAYQKNRKKEYEKRSSEYLKGKNKDFQNDRSRKKVGSYKSRDDSSVSENKENNSSSDKNKEDEVKGASDKKGTRPKSGNEAEDGGGNEGKRGEADKKDECREAEPVAKRRKSLEYSSKPGSSIKNKKDDDKEDLKKACQPSSSATKPNHAEKPSNTLSGDKKKFSKSEVLTRRNTTEEDSATSLGQTRERRKSLESQESLSAQSGGAQAKKDPRLERRIRNKDRPALEIYRPGMGKYSKQRLEKVLGSSTERDTPSPSPSITSN